MSVTRLGVSLLNVVATIDSPASHHGTARPETKNSDVLLPARLPKNSAGTKQMSRETTTITQSMSWRCMCFSLRADDARQDAANAAHDNTDSGESDDPICHAPGGD